MRITVTKKDAEARSVGIGFFGLLAIVFITLKLTGFIDWSWWWVLAPLWGPIALLAWAFLLGAVLIGLAIIFDR